MIRQGTRHSVCKVSTTTMDRTEDCSQRISRLPTKLFAQRVHAICMRIIHTHLGFIQDFEVGGGGGNSFGGISQVFAPCMNPYT